MSTAIIVSGSVRNMLNAANSWKFKGDYHLTIDRFSYFPQSNNISSDNVQELKSIVDNSPIKFTSVNVCLDDRLVKTSAIPMAWKWKRAYYNLLPYQSVYNYSKVLLLRPDLYINPHSYELDNFKINDNTIYSHSKLYLNKNDPTYPNALRSTDLFLYMSMNMFNKLSDFYDYSIKHLGHGHEIHSLLAKFMIENDIEMNDDMKNLCDVIVLRDLSNHMFENGLLKEEYSFTDIVNSTYQWWTEKYK